MLPIRRSEGLWEWIGSWRRYAARVLKRSGLVMNLRHHSLVAWQRADDLFIRLHKLTIYSFPAIERFELSAQLRKAAYSVPANIVEGYARRHRRERLHFLNIAEGSLAEVSYCVHAAWRLGYLTQERVRSSPSNTKFE